MADEDGEAAHGKESRSSQSLSSAPGNDSPSPSSPTKSATINGNGVRHAASPSSPGRRKTRAAASKRTVESPGRSPAKKRVAVKRAPKKSKWNAENILADPQSPLASANLRSLLSSPMAWDALDADDKAEVLALFPDRALIVDADTEEARPDLQALMNDDSFRHDCATYTENLSLGRFDPEWLACAWAAHEQRKIGDFDKHLIEKFEDTWEVDLPDDFKPKRGLPWSGSEVEEVGEKGEQAGVKGTDKKDAQDQHNSQDEDRQVEMGPSQASNVCGMAADGDERTADKLVIDELQDEDRQSTAQRTPLVRRQGIKMDIDGAEAEDELA